MLAIILVILAYLMGSVSTAVVVSKLVFGTDIREHGSGNAGATNTFRVLGKKAGLVVMIVDLLKGFFAVKLALMHTGYVPGTNEYVGLQVALGVAAVVGHIFPIWANFRGGKGIATLFGMILAIQPQVAGLLVIVFIVMLLSTKYVSLSSISASIAFPILILFIYNEPEVSYRVFAVAAALLVVLTHHKNINRLIKGNESKMPLFKKKEEREE
jgi:acyl phosphate:glycerol-3-phosphate acyltransferase